MTKKLVLTVIWWVSGIALISLVVFLASRDGVFGAHGDAAIDWLLPHLIPTMTLTGAAAYVERSREAPPDAEPGQAPFILACVASGFYLLLVTFFLLSSISGVATESENGVIDTLLAKNKVLGIFQGLAASAIGVFFVKR